MPRQKFTALFYAVLASIATAQESASPPKDESGDEKIVVLSPFVVSTNKDTGYIATNSLAGSRLNMSLANTPASISVMTKDFLNDIGAINVNQAMGYALDAGFDISGGASNDRGDTGNGLVGRSYNYQVRGYRQATQTRDYFVTPLDGDMFNIDRIDIARGPNSLLFGVGGPSGVINTTVKQANTTRDFGQLTMRLGSWNMNRAGLDVNQALLNGKLGLRVNLMRQKADGYHDFEQDNQKRGALAITVRPTESTTIRANAEAGRLHQNRVRPWAASEGYSKWVGQGSHFYAYGTPQSPAGLLAPIQSAGVLNDKNYSQAQNTSNLGAVNNGLPFATAIDGQGEQLTANSGSYNYFLDGPLAGKVVFSGGDSSLGGGIGSYRGARYYRTSTSYGSKSGFDTPMPTRDETVFPRTGNLAGPGQYTDTDYNVTSATIEQKIGQNLYLEATANRTYVKEMGRTTLGFGTIYVTYDATSLLPTFRDDYRFAASLGGPTTTGQGRGALNFGQSYTNLLTGATVANPAGGGMIPNPYAGQMMLSYNPSYSTNYRLLEDYRVSATYHLDLGKFGNHNLLAFVSRSDTDSKYESFAIGNVDPNRANQNVSVNVPSRVRHVDLHSANQADRGLPDPWLDPMPASSVIFGSPSIADGSTYKTEFFTPGFYRNGISHGTRRIDSAALASQSSFLKDSLVTTLGGRRDVIRSYNDNTVRDAATTIYTGLTPATYPSVNQAGNTYSAGAVYHLPFKRLQWLSVFANRSTNFQDQAGAQRLEDETIRTSMEIGPLKGKGEDFGIKTQFFDGRINATLTRFAVHQDNVAQGVASSNVNIYINTIWTTILNKGPNTTITDAQSSTGHHFGGTDTKSQQSTGWELEVTANPTADWRIAFNVSKSDNVISNLGGSLAAYLAKHRGEWEANKALAYDTSTQPGYLNNAGGSNTIGALVYGLENVFMPYTKANEGLSQINVRPWKANVFSSYLFSGGWLKGLTVGAGVNYNGPELLGFKTATVADPSVKTFYGHAYYLVNGMLAYEIKLKNKQSLRLQFNVDNLLDLNDLQVLTSAYDSATSTLYPWYYHLLPRSYSLTATLNF